MDNCCQNCKYYDGKGYCKHWFDRTIDITGFENANIAWCESFEEKEKNKMNKSCKNCYYYNSFSNYCAVWEQDIKNSESSCASFIPDLTEKENDMINHNSSDTNTPSGDNFPNYTKYSQLQQDRYYMIEKLIINELGKITKDDITDFKIDVEIYNKKCRKEIIKERYKHRRKKK